MENTPPVDRLEEFVFSLLAATESLWLALVESSSSEEWIDLLERRSAAFYALERAASDASGRRASVSAAVRACLERISELDVAILQAGGTALEQLQKERIALASRRRAVLAHGIHERELPRAVTVKA
jgi:hypothetical protein